ncbi:hypothetical protein V8F20_006174 [Naviculisporaceae sp. PSN 640]
MAVINIDPRAVDNPNPSPDPGHTADEVDGMNIFWILFALSVVSSIHSLGSAPGFAAEFTRYFRILPISSLFDLLVLYLDFLRHWSPRQRWRQHRPDDTSYIRRALTGISMLVSSARISARQITIQRLVHSLVRLPDDPDSENEEEDEPLIERLRLRVSISSFSLLDFWPRFFANAGVILVYTKICGFINVPGSIAIATVYFASWVSMEVFLYFAFGLGIRGKDQSTSSVHRQELKNFLDQPRQIRDDTARRERIQRAIGVLLIVGQLIALFVGFVVAAVTWAKDAGEDRTPAQEEDQENAFWGFVNRRLLLALTNPDAIWDVLGWKWGLFKSSWRTVLQVGDDNIVLYILAAVLMGLLTAILIYPFVLVSFFIFYIPGLLATATLISPLIMLVLLVPCCLNLYDLFPSYCRNIETRAEKVSVERWHLFLRVAILGLIGGALGYFNVFFNGRQTGKEHWTGKLD